MTTIDGARLMSELRTLAAQARNDNPGLRPAATSPAQGFGNVLGSAIRNVNEQQLQAADLQQRVEIGDRSVSLVQAMIATQKANISLSAAVQVRNKLVTAYQDVFNMPI